MLSDLEIYRAAQATISRYGDEADLHAAMRAVEWMAAGDVKRRAVWHRIERAIDELQRTAPGRQPLLVSPSRKGGEGGQDRHIGGE